MILPKPKNKTMLVGGTIQITSPSIITIMIIGDGTTVGTGTPGTPLAGAGDGDGIPIMEAIGISVGDGTHHITAGDGVILITTDITAHRTDGTDITTMAITEITRITTAQEAPDITAILTEQGTQTEEALILLLAYDLEITFQVQQIQEIHAIPFPIREATTVRYKELTLVREVRLRKIQKETREIRELLNLDQEHTIQKATTLPQKVTAHREAVTQEVTAHQVQEAIPAQEVPVHLAVAMAEAEDVPAEDVNIDFPRSFF